MACALFVSCSSGETPLDDAEIRLTCAVDGLSAGASTRAAYDGNTLPAEGLGVCFARVDGQVDNSFPAYASTSSLAATLSANGLVSFAVKQLYLEDNIPTRFVGWHPEGVFADGAVTLGLTGTQDVMLTEEREGSLSHPFGTGDNTFTFSHCLSQLQVASYVYSDADVVKYGKIQSIRVLNQPTECKLSLPSGISFSGSAPLALNNSLDDAPMSEVDLTGSTAQHPALCGYLLFAPQGNGSLDLEIVTESYGTYPLTIQLPNSGRFEAGKLYTVRLRFGGDRVAFEPITIADWTDYDRILISDLELL